MDGEKLLPGIEFKIDQWRDMLDTGIAYQDIAPAIGIDPRDGRRFLCMNELMTEEIDGLPEAETAKRSRLCLHIFATRRITITTNGTSVTWCCGITAGPCMPGPTFRRISRANCAGCRLRTTNR